jgi:hypothetical protein
VVQRHVKFLCPACERLLDLERFSLEGAALVVTCQRCGAASRAGAEWATPAPVPAPPPSSPGPRVSLVSSPHASNVVTLKAMTSDAVQRAALAAEAPLEVPAGLCPKCLAARGTGRTCAACGLAYDGFRPAMVEPPGWLRTGWVELLRDWGNDARHERLRSEASARGTLPELGRLYRLRLASVADDPWATAGREEVLRLAQAAVSANLSGGPPPEAAGGRRWLAVALLVALVASATALARLLLFSQG